MTKTHRCGLRKLVREIKPVQIDGEWFPYLVPRRTYEDNTEFDKAVCKVGMREFLRPIMRSDYPDRRRAFIDVQGLGPPAIPKGTNSILVRELSEGIRQKLYIGVFWAGDN